MNLTISLLVLALSLPLFYYLYKNPYYRLLNKGYGVLSILVIYILSLFVGISIVVACEPFWFVDNELLDIFLMVFINSTPLFTLGLILPRRSKRQTGKRKTRVSWTFLIFIHVIITMSILYIINSESNLSTSQTGNASSKIIIYWGLPFAFFLYSVKRRFDQKSIEETPINKGNFILYIRSFHLDKAPFFIGNIARNNIYKQISKSSILERLKGEAGRVLTFSQFFSKTINEKIGPLIGLGNPEDYAPMEGLTASYFEDEGWQETFYHLAKDAKAIILLQGLSDGLSFEINTIKNNGWFHKLFVFTRPNKANTWNRIFFALEEKIRCIKPSDWIRFTNILKESGINISPEKPEPGSIIAFHESGEAIQLTKGAKNPIQYVNVLVEWLSNKQIEN